MKKLPWLFIAAFAWIIISSSGGQKQNNHQTFMGSAFDFLEVPQGFLWNDAQVSGRALPLGPQTRSFQGDSNKTEDVLQYTAGRHVLRFRKGEMFIASGDHAVQLVFVNARPVIPTAGIPSEEKENTGGKAPALGRVIYRGLWERVTAVYEKSAGGILKSSYRIEPGRDGNPVGEIRLRYNRPVRIDKNGDLVISYERGEMREQAPTAWQEDNGGRIPVRVTYRSIDRNEIGFEAGRYDISLPLIIDPVLTWNTFLGGNSDDMGLGIAVDESGNVYVTGGSATVWGSPIRPFTSSYDAFVAKLDTGGTLLWNTFLGGSQYDVGNSIAVDESGNVYVTGQSATSWGSPIRAFAPGYDDAFVAKLDSGGTLHWNTFLGGSRDDHGYGIAVDVGGNSYITGVSEAAWGSPIREYSEEASAFVAKFDTGGTLLWNTFLGGWGWDIAVDGSGGAYVTGYSTDTWGSPIRPYSADRDAFVAKLDTGGTLLWNTFLGGSAYDRGYGIAVDGIGNTYVTGESWAAWGLPIKEYTSSYSSAKDAFVAKLDTNGALLWNTFLGGSGDDDGYDIAVDGSGNAYVIGDSLGTWGSPIRVYTSDQDAFVAKLNASGTLLWNGFLGGSGTDQGFGIAVDGSGSAYVMGQCNTTWGSPVRAYSSVRDAFVAKISETVGRPTIRLSRSALNFGALAEGVSTRAQSIIVSNAGGGTLLWAASSDKGWLGIFPTSGTGTTAIQISVVPAGLSAGKYSGIIAVSNSDYANDVQMIYVTLVIKPLWSNEAPTGAFDSPLPGATGLAGAIPVTGWAVDDVEVVKVEILRDNIAGEAPGQWAIGEAIVVEGARPDIEVAFPEYPLNYLAGWGYMMLTNFLPGNGNGTYTLYAYAIDKEGNRALLGTKTITCDNAHATKPFGTIDSPAQGGSAASAAYANFGWVLTPQPKTVPKDGSTIFVYVDSVLVGDLTTAPSVYNQYRPDVSGAFPGLNNSDGPVGAYFLDTTKFTNGVHTIAWVATDDQGAADGIGSRYFSIVNPATSAVANQAMRSIKPSKADSFYSVKDFPLSFEPMKVKRGFNMREGPEVIVPDHYGTIRVEMMEIERIELDLGKGENYRGFLLVKDEYRPLPIGSTLDQSEGIFSWMPGPGFLGKYDLVFIKEDNFGVTIRIPIQVTIKPKF